MNATQIKAAMQRIAESMEANKLLLVKLDQQNGDGDLGLSMAGGFGAVVQMLEATGETDLGRLFHQMSRTFNEAAPSSLGTILSFGMLGMAQSLKGKTDATVGEMACAMQNGLEKIMVKAGSKPGEKTVLDALFPAVETLQASADAPDAWSKAADAAAAGSENTRSMRAVHGRASYYGDKTIGMLDGGSVVGKLIFEAIVK